MSGGRGESGGEAGAGRRSAVSQARVGVVYLWLECLAGSGPADARAIGLHPAMIFEAPVEAGWRSPTGKNCSKVSKPEEPSNIPLRSLVSLVSSDELRGSLLQTFVVDPATSHHIIIGKGERVKMHHGSKIFVPHEALVGDL